MESFIIYNITQSDVKFKRLRILANNKRYFPAEIKGVHKKYPIKVKYNEYFYESSYSIGSKDGKSRSGILNLGKQLFEDIISICIEDKIKISAIDDIYKIEKLNLNSINV